ncbi:MAG TPA: hypothetical protein VLD65_10480, partial [Anaerolineales bacterium]|nr:hypothetical protein [Anaerolineales bacterium]
GTSWESHELFLPPDDWTPLQLGFTSPASGWMVMQKVTSGPFEASILLKTQDGGLTWKIIDLPTTGKITFTSPAEGWLMNSENEQLFSTVDGGSSWKVADLSDYPMIKVNLPAGTTLSGGQGVNLAWAATSNGSCQGVKGSPEFICQVDHRLWQSVDGGKDWQVIPMPISAPVKQ